MTFTSEKPTVPGAYWWQPTQLHDPLLVRVTSPHRVNQEAFLVVSGHGIQDEYLNNLSGLWSSRLVPCEEVEEAYREGWRHGRFAINVDPPFEQSRARRVVDGKEEV